MRMHLVARVPNDGAHALARWIGAQQDREDAIARLTRRMGTWSMMINRILSGEIVPGEPERVAITAVTRGAVQPRDWGRHTKTWWFDAPVSRRGRRAA